MSNTALYSTDDFERQFTYLGPDLGAVWSAQCTTFRLWAPQAKSVTILLYRSGNPGVDDRIERIPMTASVAGTWTAQIPGDRNGVYYTYLVEREEGTVEACDPYARSTGVNGIRAMILDLDSTDPPGWKNDRDPHYGAPITDAVIYELHLRDVSCDPDSGIRHKGKFLGLAETGTKTSLGIPTGLDHIKRLGITHVHLMPCFDYGAVDETHPEHAQYNWGYNPVNFNVPEGSYATDPYRGEVRVREMKQMIHALHRSGISVVMDVVYNHVFDAKEFCFNQIVPDYFSRTLDGWYSGGSGCGNDTASERSMVRKYIVDSVKYWADEYHIDGFRFDLVGLLDVQTINEVIAAVHQTHPNVIFYGEGWNMDTHLTKPDVALAVHSNANLTPGMAYFSDTMRDLLRGFVFDDTRKGYVAGEPGQEELLQKCFQGLPDWCPEPDQCVNYASCHDNMTLFDRLATSAGEESLENRIRMNRLAAAIVVTSQGVPFLMAGEELHRSKSHPDGSLDRNSFASPDFVNAIRWNSLADEETAKTAAYYQGLIALRRAHPTFRLRNDELVRQQVFPMERLAPNVVGFHLRGSVDDDAQAIIVLFNPNKAATQVELPKGKWNVCVNADAAGTSPLAVAEHAVTLEPISACVLTLDPPVPEQSCLPFLLGGIAAAAAISGTMAYLNHRKKRDGDSAK